MTLNYSMLMYLCKVIFYYRCELRVEINLFNRKELQSKAESRKENETLRVLCGSLR
jgi:hypothetical protein